MTEHAKAVGGPIFTRSWFVLAGFAALGFFLIFLRFALGLGATTALSDGYPWGLWIAFDVVTGTAFACGGYAVALLVYIFNKGKYHPLIRPAILTSAMGYTIAGLSVGIDVGRPWWVWKVPLFFWQWNFDSVLLEVALCIMAYMLVLWIELSPAFFEVGKESKWPWLKKISLFVSPILDKALIFIIALGMLLPTMHQSSLGSLMLISGPRLHPLWNTGFVPFFFLITCIAMGYSIVVFESTFSAVALKRKPETHLLINLQKIAAGIGILFVVLRFLDLIAKGRMGLAFQSEFVTPFFWLESILFLIPVFFLFGRKSMGTLFASAITLALAGALYRFDTFLVAFNPGPGWHYFPSFTEQFVTFGLISFEVLVYATLVKLFPILAGISKPARPVIPAKSPLTAPAPTPAY